MVFKANSNVKSTSKSNIGVAYDFEAFNVGWEVRSCTISLSLHQLDGACEKVNNIGCGCGLFSLGLLSWKRHINMLNVALTTITLYPINPTPSHGPPPLGCGCPCSITTKVHGHGMKAITTIRGQQGQQALSLLYLHESKAWAGHILQFRELTPPSPTTTRIHIL
jgi:hypothetical protein